MEKAHGRAGGGGAGEWDGRKVGWRQAPCVVGGRQGNEEIGAALYQWNLCVMG